MQYVDPNGIPGLPQLITEAIEYSKAGLSNLLASVKSEISRRQTLASINPDFRFDFLEVTNVIDYSKFHEDPKDLTSGNGLLCSATYGEIDRMWSQQDRFIHYEAQLRRERKARRDSMRVFAYDHRINNRTKRLLLIEALMRHSELGLDPHICSILDHRKMATILKLSCDTIGSINGKTSYLTQTKPTGDPIFVRHINTRRVTDIENKVGKLWNESDPASRLLKYYSSDIPPDLIKRVKAQVKAIKLIAA